MTDLPTSWVFAPLENLIAPDGIFTDGDWVESKDQDPNGEVRLIQLADIADSRFLDKSSRYLTREKADELNCTFLRKGDLMVARMPDPLGRCCIFPLDGKERFVTVVDVCAIRVGSAEIDPRYLMRAINSPVVRAQVSSLQSGSTRKRISRRNLAQVSVPVAPLNEQRRIVERIDALFDEIDRGVESLRTARKMIGLYRQSLLKSAFEGRLTTDWRAENPDKLENPELLLARISQQREACYDAAMHDWERALGKWRGAGGTAKRPTKPKPPHALPAEQPQHDVPGWVTVSLGLVIDDPIYGTPKKCGYGTGATGVLRIPNIGSGCIDPTDLKSADFDESEVARFSLSEGDVLTVRSNGSLSIVGKPALVRREHADYLFAGYLIRLRPVAQSLLPKYLVYTLTEPQVRAQIETKAKSTSGVNNVSAKELQELGIRICSIAEQSEIVRILDRRLEVADTLLAEIDANLARSEALRQSILRTAFAGRLVPQDLADEPASALLARVRAEGTSARAKERRKRVATAAVGTRHVE